MKNIAEPAPQAQEMFFDNQNSGRDDGRNCPGGGFEGIQDPLHPGSPEKVDADGL